MLERPQIAIVDWHEKRAFYKPLTEAFAADWSDVAPPALAVNPPAVDLIIVNDETWPFCAAGIAEANRRRIPTLHLPDGICEWRNTWENARRMPFMQPVLATTIACLGAAQARLIESWGNQGKCVVTGSPRFDALIGRRPRVREGSEAPAILIATARQPAFNSDHRQAVTAALVDLQTWFRGHPEVRPIWRLTSGLDEEVGVENTMRTPLLEQLGQVDAVIATPGNVILEAMLHGLPVAMCDYTNSPAYITAAWTITASAHIPAIIPGLLSPVPHRLAWQRTLLADQLECRTPATPRVIELIERMIGGRAATGAPNLPPDSRNRELETEIAHLRHALAIRPAQILYRALCELKRRLGSRP